MQFEIKHWITGSVLFSFETESLKLCVETAVKYGADLKGADLKGADLKGADLKGAVIWGADLGGADLRGADLSGAVIWGADLRGADLSGANLSGADLGGADLRGADLDLANLSGADLGGADLRGADLDLANLSGAKIRYDVIITKAPIQISGLEWPVTIWDQHMQIGCEFHSHEEWKNFSDDEWMTMGGKEALYLKRNQFPAILALCEQHKPKS